MKRKQSFFVGIILAGLVTGCNSGSRQPAYVPSNATLKEPGDKSGIPVVMDDSKGRGKFTDIKLTHPLSSAMVAKGRHLYEVKCVACHKLTDEKLVGPGWMGVTDRRKPEWIMNYITNTDEMIDKDPTAGALLEKYKVRMPDQHLSDNEARQVLEFMRSNDGKN